MNELLEQFEKLIQEKTVVFNHDVEDGFFIKVCNRGENFLQIAEIEPEHHKTIESAIVAAVGYLKKQVEDFEKVIEGIHDRNKR
ncbi:hypothetical protein VB776_06965 [Arcicella sp. DC2W]|uniref:Phage protein n=1 Tax=Arcicella gelida TaxID=2984195 RepID=A0ABU5S301_9BACT|nr:hypothetical protein [Arcicella sp. DC2W]MEA5402648.1 hypothetical protein [Arcicella sp. DC2W]